MIVYTLCSIYRDPKNPIPPIEQFWPLPTDDLEGNKEQREKEGDRLAEKLRKFKQKHLKKK